jgi:hypothetical protein
MAVWELVQPKLCISHRSPIFQHTPSHFLFQKNPLESVEILSPEANLSSSHKTKTISFRRCALAEADAHRDFLLKTGLKSEFSDSLLGEAR